MTPDATCDAWEQVGLLGFDQGPEHAGIGGRKGDGADEVGALDEQGGDDGIAEGRRDDSSVACAGEADAWGRIGSEFGPGEIGFGQMTLGEFDGIGADDIEGIGEGAFEEGGIELGFGGEDVEGVESGEGVVGLGEGFAEERGCGGILILVEESGDGFAMPTVGMGEEFDPASDGSGGEVADALGGGGWVEVGGGEAPEASAVITGVEVKMTFEAVGKGPGVFDGLAIHVEDPEAAIGGVDELDGAEPVVGGGKELGVRFGGIAFADPLEAVGPGPEFLPMDEIGSAIGDEGIAGDIGWIGIAAMDGGAGGAGEVAGGTATAFDWTFDEASDAPTGAQDAPGFVGGTTEDGGGGAIGGDAHPGGGEGIEGIVGKIGIVVDDLLEVIGIGADESASGGVEGHPVLSAAGGGFESEGPGIEGEIATAQGDGCGRGILDAVPFEPGAGERGIDALHATGGEAGDAVDALVEAPMERIEHRLDIEFGGIQGGAVGAEASEDPFLHIGAAIAIGVLQVPDVGSGPDEDTAVPAGDGGGPGQASGEEGGGIDASVEIVIGEFADGAEAFVAAFGVIAHLDDPGGAGFVEGEGDGIDDQGFGGDELGGEAGTDVEGLEGEVGRGGGDAGELGGIGDGFGGGGEGHWQGGDKEAEDGLAAEHGKIKPQGNGEG